MWPGLHPIAHRDGICRCKIPPVDGCVELCILSRTASKSFGTDGLSVSLEANNLQRATSPGLFTATSGGVSSRYAVNILPEESNFTRVATSSLYDAVVNPDTSPLQSREAQTAELIEELENPQRLWWWILTLVMVLLLVEVLVANRTYR